MRLPAPVVNVMREARYRETHHGLPLVMQVFWAVVRAATLMLILVVIFAPAVIVKWLIPTSLGPVVFFAVALAQTQYWLYMLPYTRFDIFFMLGFRLFRRLIEVR